MGMKISGSWDRNKETESLEWNLSEPAGTRNSRRDKMTELKMIWVGDVQQEMLALIIVPKQMNGKS